MYGQSQWAPSLSAFPLDSAEIRAGALPASLPTGPRCGVGCTFLCTLSHKALWGLIVTSSSCSISLRLPIAPKQVFRPFHSPCGFPSSPQSPTAMSHFLPVRTLTVSTLTNARSFLRLWQTLTSSANFP